MLLMIGCLSWCLYQNLSICFLFPPSPDAGLQGSLHSIHPSQQRACRIHGSGSELPSVQFPNQKCISKNGGWLHYCMSHPCFLLWAQKWGWSHEMLDSFRASHLKAPCCRDCFSSSWVWQSPNKLISWGTHLIHVLWCPAKKQDKLTLPKLSAGTARLLPICEQAWLWFNHVVCSPVLVTDLHTFLNANWSWAEWHSNLLGFTLCSWLEIL